MVPVLAAMSSVGLLVDRLVDGGPGLYLRLGARLGRGLLLYWLAQNNFFQDNPNYFQEFLNHNINI